MFCLFYFLQHIANTSEYTNICESNCTICICPAWVRILKHFEKRIVKTVNICLILRLSILRISTTQHFFFSTYINMYVCMFIFRSFDFIGPIKYYEHLDDPFVFNRYMADRGSGTLSFRKLDAKTKPDT